MPKLRIFLTSFALNKSRYWSLYLVCVASLWFPFCNPVLADYDPSKYTQIFGEPEQFIQDFEDALTPKLNEYMGLGISVSGFILVIRSLMH